ncbi:MAG: HlyD family efflux transporter periplasmic adaptor subunit [Chloroflexota bacterium]
MFQNKKLWIILFFVIVIIGGGYYYYSNFYRSTNTEAETPTVQTAVARRGNLTVFASGAGSVVPASEIGVGFDESGTLIEILVNVGDKVKVGEVIARLDTGQSEAEIALSMAQAELNLLNAQQALDEIYASADMEAALTLQAVEDAERDLEDLSNVDLRQAQALQAIAEAEEALAEAQRYYNNVRTTANQFTIDSAYSELVLAEDQLKDAKERFEIYADKPDGNLDKANAQLQLSSVQAAYDSALRNYNYVTSTGSDLDKALTDADLLAAQAQLAEAQKEWNRIKDGPTPGEVALAEAQLKVAQAEWEILKDGADPADIALTEAQLANAEANLALALEEQAIVELVAPLDGTIMDISVSVGEKVGTSAIITLADLSQPVLEVYLDETDLNKVGINFEVEVIFDALPDDVYIGHIIEVDPSLQNVSNVQVVRVLAMLDADSFAKPQNLPVGLNASVDVIGGRAEGAVLVPVEALLELSPGEYAVFVVEDGEPKLRIVTVGLMDFTSAEIITGLDAGEVVTTGIVETE